MKQAIMRKCSLKRVMKSHNIAQENSELALRRLADDVIYVALYSRQLRAVAVDDEDEVRLGFRRGQTLPGTLLSAINGGFIVLFSKYCPLPLLSR